MTDNKQKHQYQPPPLKQELFFEEDWNELDILDKSDYTYTSENIED